MIYDSQQHGFDPALEEVLPIHNLITVAMYQGTHDGRNNRPYHTRTGSSRFADLFCFKGFELISENEGEIVVKNGTRVKAIRPYNGGFEVSEFSPNLSAFYTPTEDGFTKKSRRFQRKEGGGWELVEVDKPIHKDVTEEDVSAFATQTYILRPAQPGEVSSILPFIRLEGNLLFNETLVDLEPFEDRDDASQMDFEYLFFIGERVSVRKDLTLNVRGEHAPVELPAEFAQDHKYKRVQLNVKTGRYSGYSFTLNLDNQ